MPTLFRALAAFLARYAPRPTHPPRPLPSADTPVIRFMPATGSTYRLGGDGRWWLVDAVPDVEPLSRWDAELLRPVAASLLAAELQPPYPRHGKSMALTLRREPRITEQDRKVHQLRLGGMTWASIARLVDDDPETIARRWHTQHSRKNVRGARRG